MPGLKMKYFVLNPESSSDPLHAAASRAAILAYATAVEAANPQLAQDLRDWVASI